MNKRILLIIFLFAMIQLAAAQQSDRIELVDVSYPENKIVVEVALDIDGLDINNIILKDMFYESLSYEIFKSDIHLFDPESPKNFFVFTYDKDLVTTKDQWETEYVVKIQILDKTTDETIGYRFVPVEAVDPDYYTCNNNGVCDKCTEEGCPYFETEETYETCPNDCPLEEEYTDEPVTQSDSQPDYGPTSPGAYAIVLLITIVLAITLYFILYLRKRKEQPEDELYKEADYYLKQGFTKEQVREFLIRRKWPQKQVEKTLSKLGAK